MMIENYCIQAIINFSRNDRLVIGCPFSGMEFKLPNDITNDLSFVSVNLSALFVFIGNCFFSRSWISWIYLDGLLFCGTEMTSFVFPRNSLLQQQQNRLEFQYVQGHSFKLLVYGSCLSQSFISSELKFLPYVEIYLKNKRSYFRMVLYDLLLLCKV